MANIKSAKKRVLVNQTKAAMLANKESKMWELCNGDIENAGGRTAFDGMRAGDEKAKQVVEKYMGYLACGMANIINTFQPEILCVGGGVGNEKENLLGPVRKLVEAQVYSIHAKKQTRICAAELGNDAGIIGAALLTE